MRPFFRDYSPSDRRDCMAIFSSNVPRFFRERERADFEAFIDTSGCPYFVVGVSHIIVGCGGYGIREPGGLADLCWGMIDASYHGNHCGEFLLLARLREIVDCQNVTGVRLTTSQLTEGFFQRYGFEVQSREADGIDDGLDSVEMRLDLTRDLRASVLARWQSMSGDSESLNRSDR